MQSHLDTKVFCRNILVAAALLASAALQAGTLPPGNIVPNASLRGDYGAVAATNATITGPVPTLWRAFAAGGAALSLQQMALGANVLFPGSPPTQALKITVSAFGATYRGTYSETFYDVNGSFVFSDAGTVAATLIKPRD